MNRPAFLNPAASTRVILVRHGRSTYNDQGRYQGSSDEAMLTEKGRQDAFQTGLALRDIDCSALYASPLHRAQQTAQEILAAFRCSRRPIPVTLHPDLKEIDLPQWAGRRYQEVRETLADHYRCWIERPHKFEMRSPAHELPQRPVPNLYAQAQRFWQQVLPCHAGQTLLVVSHGGTIRALINTALGIPCSHFHAQQQSNCGISILNFPHRQPVQLEVINDTSHLGEVLPKLKAGRQGLRLLLVPDTSAPMPLRSLFDLMEINFSLSQGEPALAFSKALLAHQSQTVHLQTEQADVSRLWLQALNNRQLSRQAEDGIVTGLWVAKPKMLQEMLSHVIGAGASMREALSLAPGRISVIHDAPSQSLPIVQAMNFSDAVLSMKGLMLCAS